MAIWKASNDWIYEYFPFDAETSIFEGFEGLVELWRSKCGNQEVPDWSKFDFYDFKGWHGSLILTEYYYDPFDYKYLIFGTRIAHYLGVEVTGKLASELGNSKYNPAKDFDFYEMAGKGLYITKVTREMLWRDEPKTTVSFIELPMSNDGKRANKYLSAMKWEENTPGYV